MYLNKKKQHNTNMLRFEIWTHRRDFQGLILRMSKQLLIYNFNYSYVMYFN